MAETIRLNREVTCSNPTIAILRLDQFDLPDFAFVFQMRRYKSLVSLPLHYFDQRRVDIIDQVELWSPRQVTHLPPVWDLSLPLA